MPRYLFSCAYDGTLWRGWQSQSGGGTVQDCLEAAFEAILRQSLRIHAAGRTDAGVHALAQCFHADVPEGCRMSPAAWVAALNAHLPASVRIGRAEPVAADFHARFSALGKVYEYRIWRGAVLPPHLRMRMAPPACARCRALAAGAQLLLRRARFSPLCGAPRK